MGGMGGNSTAGIDKIVASDIAPSEHPGEYSKQDYSVEDKLHMDTGHDHLLFYLKEINKIPLLTREREIQLGTEIRKEYAAADSLLEKIAELKELKKIGKTC